jgi:hypothetical protein
MAGPSPAIFLSAIGGIRMRYGLFRQGAIAILVLTASSLVSDAAMAQSCKDLAGRWTGPWTFKGPRASTPRSTLTVVVAADCSYMFSGQYWNGLIRTPGRFTISGKSISYRNDAGSYGPVTLRGAGKGASLTFVQTQGNYVATVTRAGR